MGHVEEGARAFFAISVILLLALTGFMYWRFACRPHNHLVTVVVCVSWMLGLLSSALLPYDIALSSIEQSSSRQSAWFGLYWTTWVLAWMVNPILGTALARYVSGAFPANPRSARRSPCTKARPRLPTVAHFPRLNSSSFPCG